MARFDLVIFDCDGVVVDSERIVFEVFGAFIRSLGVHLTDAETRRAVSRPHARPSAWPSSSG